MRTFQKIQEARILPVIRKADQDNIIPIATAVDYGGIRAIEITAETPEVEQLINKVRVHNEDMLVGAGTVLDPETARAVIMAGA